MKSIIVAIVILVSVGGGFLFWKNRPASSTASSKPMTSEENWQQLNKSFKSTVNKHLSSPAGMAWQGRDFDKLMGLFGADKDLKQNLAFFQATIYILDSTQPKWKPEEQVKLSELRQKLVQYVTSDKVEVIGEQARASAYASKIVLKLGALSDSEIGLLEKAQKQLKSTIHKEIIEDTLVRLSPLPPSGKSVLQRYIQSKNEIAKGMKLMAQMNDPAAHADLMNDVFKRYKSYPAQAQPMVLKQLTLNHKMVKGDLKPYLKTAGSKKDQDWNDAFLSGVREMKLGKEFGTEIGRIRTESEHPHIKMLAEAILTSEKGDQR